MDYSEIKKIQRIVKKHYAAYSIGLQTNVENTYPVRSEKFQAFNVGRLERLRRQERKKG